MLDENTVNAVDEEVVTPQPEQTNEVVESDDSDVTTEQQAEKVVQSPEENSKFAEVRRKAAQEAEDKVYRDLYGAEYGIQSKADYDRAIKEQQQAELKDQARNGDIDPDELYKQLKASDPDFIALKELRTETYTRDQLAQLNKDLKADGVDVEINSLDDLAKLDSADSMAKYIERGNTLSEAYFLANRASVINARAEKLQKETLTKINALQGSPGALDQTAGTESKDSYSTMSKADFEKLMEDVQMGRRG